MEPAALPRSNHRSKYGAEPRPLSAPLQVLFTPSFQSPEASFFLSNVWLGPLWSSLQPDPASYTPARDSSPATSTSCLLPPICSSRSAPLVRQAALRLGSRRIGSCSRVRPLLPGKSPTYMNQAHLDFLLARKLDSNRVHSPSLPPSHPLRLLPSIYLHSHTPMQRLSSTSSPIKKPIVLALGSAVFRPAVSLVLFRSHSAHACFCAYRRFCSCACVHARPCVPAVLFLVRVLPACDFRCGFVRAQA